MESDINLLLRQISTKYSTLIKQLDFKFQVSFSAIFEKNVRTVKDV